MASRRRSAPPPSRGRARPRWRPRARTRSRTGRIDARRGERRGSPRASRPSPSELHRECSGVLGEAREPAVDRGRRERLRPARSAPGAARPDPACRAARRTRPRRSRWSSPHRAAGRPRGPDGSGGTARSARAYRDRRGRGRGGARTSQNSARPGNPKRAALHPRVWSIRASFSRSHAASSIAWTTFVPSSRNARNPWQSFECQTRPCPMSCPPPNARSTRATGARTAQVGQDFSLDQRLDDSSWQTRQG